MCKYECHKTHQPLPPDPPVGVDAGVLAVVVGAEPPVLAPVVETVHCDEPRAVAQSSSSPYE